MKYHCFALRRDISSITPYAACLIPRRTTTSCSEPLISMYAGGAQVESCCLPRWKVTARIWALPWQVWLRRFKSQRELFQSAILGFSLRLQTHSDPLSLYWSPINQAPERKDSRSSLILLGQEGSQYQASFQSIHLVLVVLGNRRAYILVSVDLKTSGRKHVLLCLTTVWVLTDMTFKTMQIIRRIEITNSSYHDISLLYEKPIWCTWIYPGSLKPFL